jgi:hypothetical protein
MTRSARHRDHQRGSDLVGLRRQAPANDLQSGPRSAPSRNAPKNMRELLGWARQHFAYVVGFGELAEIGFREDHSSNPYHEKRLGTLDDEVLQSLQVFCDTLRGVDGAAQEKLPFIIYPYPVTLMEEAEQHTQRRDWAWADEHLRMSKICILMWSPITAAQTSQSTLKSLQEKCSDRVPSYADRAFVLLLLANLFKQHPPSDTIELVSVRPYNSDLRAPERIWNGLYMKDGLVECEEDCNNATHVCLNF